MKIGKRLLVGFGIVILMMIAATGLGIWSILSINNALDKSVVESEKADRIHEVQNDLSQVYLHMAIIMQETDTANKQANKADLDTHRAAYLDNLKWLKEHSTAKEDFALLTILEEVLAANRDINNQVLTLSMAGQTAEAQNIYLTKALPNVPKYEKALQDILDYRAAQLAQVDQAAADLTSKMNNVLAAFAVAALLLAIFMVISITTSVTNPIQKS